MLLKGCFNGVPVALQYCSRFASLSVLDFHFDHEGQGLANGSGVLQIMVAEYYRVTVTVLQSVTE
jgi:hypothetical protein